MKSITVYEAKTQFSRLLAQVEKGEEVTVCRGKQPIARLVPYAKPPRRRPKVGEVTSKPVRWARGCFAPISGEDAELWGL
ncbi:MAG: type II toxin-antitoxin system prevent-host-death family antitoxin [Deltaproteobacteria bacterium]|nr:type II toxin-antitoxin system prevent-host-death family antitoxin [Deltaproteobacteria bacterium]